MPAEGRVEEKGVESEGTMIQVQPQAQPLPSLLPRPPAPFQPIVQPEIPSSKPQPMYTDMVRDLVPRNHKLRKNAY